MAVYGVFQITDYLMGTKGFLGNNEHFDVIVARALRFPAVLVTFATKSNACAAGQRFYAYTKAKIPRLISLARNDRSVTCVII